MRKKLVALVVSLAVFLGTVAENETCVTAYNSNSSKQAVSDHNATEKTVSIAIQENTNSMYKKLSKKIMSVKKIKFCFLSIYCIAVYAPILGAYTVCPGRQRMPGQFYRAGII